MPRRRSASPATHRRRARADWRRPCQSASRRHVQRLGRADGRVVAAVAQQPFPGRPVGPAWVGGRCRAEPRQMTPRARAGRIVGIVGRDHRDALRQRHDIRMPRTEATQEERPPRIGDHHVEGPPLVGGQGGYGGRGGRRRCSLRGEDRQVSTRPLPLGGAEAAGPVQDSRHDIAAERHPGAARHAVTPADDIGMIGPPGGRRVPDAIKSLVAICGDQQRPGMAGPMQGDDSAHGRRLRRCAPAGNGMPDRDHARRT